LTLDSVPGVGSTFSLYLPRTLQADTTAVLEALKPISRAPLRSPDEQRTADRLAFEDEAEPIDDDRSRLAPGDRILLVIEDDRSFAAVLADLAREKDFKVIIEKSAQEALRAARRFKPSAITLDLLLKDSNGW